MTSNWRNIDGSRVQRKYNKTTSVFGWVEKLIVSSGKPQDRVVIDMGRENWCIRWDTNTD